MQIHSNGSGLSQSTPVRVDANPGSQGTSQDKSVDFKFYQKPMAPPTTILNRSAMPTRVKWNNNVQQSIRRLRNTRPRLHAETRNQLMEEWAEVMMVSGYTENHRKEAIQSAVVGYERMIERDAKGQTPL